MNQAGVAGRPGYGDHSRQNSDVGYGVGVGDVKQQPSYGYQDGQPQRKESGFVNQPMQAYTNEAEPTPVVATSPENRYQPYRSNSGPAPPQGAMYPSESTPIPIGLFMS